MRIAERVCEGIWKLRLDSNLYLIESDMLIVIDTGSREFRSELLSYFPKIADPLKVKKVLFTHLHYDHIGNFDYFKNAKFYASRKEIESFEKDPAGTVLNERIAEMFDVRLHPISDINELVIVPTPGHTKGSVCVWYPKKKVIFTGDTLFSRGSVGRVDLPTSAPGELKGSIKTIRSLNYSLLCPGHDY